MLDGARRGRRRSGARHADCVPRPGRGGRAAAVRAPTSGAGSTGSSASTTTCGPPSTGRSTEPDPRGRDRPRLRDVALLAEARLPRRGARAARRAWPRRPWSHDDRSPRARLARGARRRRLVAGRLSRRATRCYDEALAIWREHRRRGARSPTPSTTASFADVIAVMDGQRRTPDDADRTGGRCSRRRSRIYQRARRPARRGQRPVGARQLPLLHGATRPAPSRGTARRSSSSARSATGRWRPGRCTCSATVAVAQRRLAEAARRTSRTRSATSTRPATSPG